MYSGISALDPEGLKAALETARGCYQRNLILGVEALSGATLRGRAATYSGRYKESANALIGRLRRSGFAVAERREPHGKRVLVIAPAQAVAQ